MLSVTVNSCIEELRPLGLSNCEIIIVDNSDEGIFRSLGSFLPVGYVKDRLIKLYRQQDPCLFSARELAIEKSSGKYVCCLDSHMLVGRDMFLDLYNFMEERNDPKIAFAHAPINWAHHHQRSAKHDRDMSVNELGDWNLAYSTPKTITWKGMPWICTKETWKTIKGYGALSWHRISWGGGDMHIGVKPWLLGLQNWAVPTNAAIHIGPFPNDKAQKKDKNSVTVSHSNGDYAYRLYGTSGNYPHTFGFLVSCYVLGGEAMMLRNKAAITKRFGKFIDVNKWWSKAIELGRDEKLWLDENKKITFEQLLETKPWQSK